MIEPKGGMEVFHKSMHIPEDVYGQWSVDVFWDGGKLWLKGYNWSRVLSSIGG